MQLDTSQGRINNDRTEKAGRSPAFFHGDWATVWEARARNDFQGGSAWLRSRGLALDGCGLGGKKMTSAADSSRSVSSRWASSRARAQAVCACAEAMPGWVVGVSSSPTCKTRIGWRWVVQQHQLTRGQPLQGRGRVASEVKRLTGIMLVQRERLGQAQLSLVGEKAENAVGPDGVVQLGWAWIQSVRVLQQMPHVAPMPCCG